MRNYDILALDVDDTLVPPSKTISAANRQAVADAMAAGVHVALATGRGFMASRPIWSELGIRGPIINYGGALIMDTVSGKPLLETEISPELVIDVLKTAAALNIHGHIYQGDRIVYGSDSEYARTYAEKLHLEHEIDAGIMDRVWHGVPKVLLMTTAESAERLIPPLQEQYRGRLQVAASSPGFIEFNCLNAQKGSALEALGRMLGVPMSRTAAIGDNSLDLEMLRAAGLGAAVADAQAEIISAADVVTPACADDGVAWLIYHRIIGEE